MRITGNIIKRSDSYGAIASTLCLIHCLTTPFIIIFFNYAQLVTTNYLGIWKSLDLVFLLTSLLMVHFSVKNTSKNFMKYIFWCSWSILFFLIMNEKLELIHLPEFMTYCSAIFLTIVHIYNLKFCQCSNEDCHCPNSIDQ